MIDVLNSAIDFFHAQTFMSFITMFWFVVFIEFPRFILAGILGVFVLLFKVKHTVSIPLPEKPIPITVLIPAHNSGKAIENTVISLSEQIGVELQIIVINDGSSDDTAYHCKRLINEGYLHDYVELASRGGKASALNVGLRRAKYDLILATDGDTTFYRDALLQAVQYFKSPKVGAVCGNLKVRNVNQSLATRLVQLNFIPSITIGRLVKDIFGFYFVISGAFGVYRKAALKEVGGWNYGPGDDGDMSVQIRLAGWDVHFAIYATATTSSPASFTKLGRQRMRWYRSMIRVRYRKFRWMNISSETSVFSFARAISFFETYYVQAVIPLMFYAYVAMLMFRYQWFGLAVLLVVHSLHFVMYTCEYLVYLTISRNRREDAKLLLYIPFYTLFHNYFMRSVSLYSSFHELILRSSYTDEFYPKKVREHVKKF